MSIAGYHVWNEIRLSDGTAWAADATGNTLAATVTAYGSGKLTPSFHHPWCDFVRPAR